MAPGLTYKEGARIWFRLMGKYIFMALVFISLLPIPILIDNKIGYMAFTIFLMGIYWLTEVMPLPVTALIPMVVFPMFGILDTNAVIRAYFPGVTFMVFGGLVLAAAIECQNLHRRFALRVLLLFGTNPIRLLLGFLSATAFLSAWMSNTAVAAMMLPIAQAVLDEVAKQDVVEKYEMKDDDVGELPEQQPNKQNDLDSEGKLEKRNMPKIESSRNLQRPKDTSDHLLLSKAIILSIPYGANVGGTGSLVGSPPNIVCVAVVESLFGEETGLNFGSWTLYCFPQLVACIIVIWMWLSFIYIYLPQRSKNRSQEVYKPERLKRVIKRAYDDLGPMRFAEWAVLGHLIILVGLWITQDPKVFPGWASFFPPGLGSATPAILITISLFMFPSERPRPIMMKIKQQIMDTNSSYHPHVETKDKEHGDPSDGETCTNPVGLSDEVDCSENRQEEAQVQTIPALMKWEVVHEKIPWGVLLIAGGGFALADGCVVSGLSAWMAERFEVFYRVPSSAVAFIIAIMISFMTEFLANTVTTTLFLPIVAEMAVAMKINPLYLMITTAVSSSFAFMLPVATPPNALAFASKEVKVIDMVKTGCLLNLLCVCVLLLFMNTLGRAIFDISNFPDWAGSDVIGPANTTDIYNWTSTVPV